MSSFVFFRLKWGDEFLVPLNQLVIAVELTEVLLFFYNPMPFGTQPSL